MFDERQSSGKHLICDIRDIAIDYTFQDVMDLMEYICDNCEFHILQKASYRFDYEQAFTIIFLLSESHFSVHTYPEKKTIALDLYTCRDYADNSQYLSILDVLKSYFRANVVYQIINREF